MPAQSPLLPGPVACLEMQSSQVHIQQLGGAEHVWGVPGTPRYLKGNSTSQGRTHSPTWKPVWLPHLQVPSFSPKPRLKAPSGVAIPTSLPPFSAHNSANGAPNLPGDFIPPGLEPLPACSLGQGPAFSLGSHCIHSC